MTSLRDALALPERAGVAVSAGPDSALTTRLLGVEVLADLRDDVPDRCGGLLLAVAGRVGAEPWRLDVLLRRAAAAGAAAVLVSVALAPGRASAQVARRLTLPVLVAPDPLRCAIALRIHLALPELAAAR
ncbi:hypothetical protein [Lapillicoccus sp.]|uniref:hypothetical protein n=1 Tax=Lapillicoccus sp. TaxID=1909287 RepID=UPI0025CCC3EB|nr:hypothetical protein [Lapillicoccus sp.]